MDTPMRRDAEQVVKAVTCCFVFICTYCKQLIHGHPHATPCYGVFVFSFPPRSNCVFFGRTFSQKNAL